VKVLQFEGKEKAFQIINDSIDLYHKTFVNSHGSPKRVAMEAEPIAETLILN